MNDISGIVSQIPKENWDKITSGSSKPIWFYNAKPVDYPKLSEDVTVDDVIVGAGFTGVTTAYLLSKAGRQVALVDDGYVGSGESGRTTAHLTYALDSRFYEIVDSVGENVAKKAMVSHKKAIDLIEENVKQTKVECDFNRVNGYLFVNQQGSKEELTKELDALKQIGNTDVEHLNSSSTSPFDVGECLRFPMQGRINPLKYLGALCGEITKNGGKIFSQTHITDFNGSEVKTENGQKINAENIVIATNVPVNRTAKMHMKQAPYRTYVVAFLVPKAYVTDALYWSTSLDQKGLASDYTYIRLQPLNGENDVLIVGAKDHKTGQTDDGGQRFDTLKAWVKEHFSQVGDVIYMWSGQVVNPGGGLGFIGRDKDNLFLATGYGGNGTTYGTLAGLAISELILGKTNDWLHIYNPERRLPGLTKDVIEENFNVAKQLVNTFIKTQEVNPDKLNLEQGTVVASGFSARKAYYKDDKGQLHTFSSICPHMGCSVTWNSAEKTFDCPCHGSRYTGYGKVVNGPANQGLKPQ
jgi:glycine/D-amino acid oxidase-like deaminating enzyme/nitrite reductase/ring-hydroxylating ferredoxin subunit